MRAWWALLLAAVLVSAGCLGGNGTGPAQDGDTGEAPDDDGALPETPDDEAGDGTAGRPSSGVACVTTPCGQRSMWFGAEPWIAVDPTDPDRAVAVAMANWNGTGTSHPWLSYAFTSDGGETWIEAQPPGGINQPDSPFGTYNFAADVMVAYANDGTAVLATLVGRAGGTSCAPSVGCPPASVFLNSLDLVVWTSSDGGRTFTEGAVVAASEGAAAFTAGVPRVAPAAGAYPDREVLTVDRETGTLHLVWSRISTTERDVLISSSTDQGASWSEPAVIDSGPYGAMAAAHNGTAIVVVREFQESTYVAYRSHDDGVTWDGPTTIGPWYDSHYEPAVPALWEEDGEVVAAVARPDGENSERVVVHMSRDGGVTWDNGTVAMGGVPSDRRIPAFSVDPATGRGLLAAYQGTSDDPDVLETWAVGFDRGTVTAPVKVSTGHTDRGAAFEYAGAAATPSGGYLVWTENNENGIATPVAGRLVWAS